MRKILFLFTFFISMHTFSAVYLKVLYIADYTTDCNLKKCLLTRDSPADVYQVFYKSIEGFTYEEGFEYCILMEIQTPGISDPPIPFDSSQVKYVLSEIKSKTKKKSSETSVKYSISIPDSSKWILYKLRTKDGTKTFSVSSAYLQFNLKNNTINGNTDCNSFTASISLDTILTFKNIITTKMNCKKFSQEATFLKMLNSTNNYKVTSKLLYLYDDKKLLALFTKKK